MAYHNGYNPDALPAFAEPEQAAQIYAKRESERLSSSTSGRPSVSPAAVAPRHHEQRASSGPTGSGPYRPRSSAPPVSPSQIQRKRVSSPPQSAASSAHGRPQSAATIAPKPAIDPSLLPLFRTVDHAGTGRLSELELGKALVNGDYTRFDTRTVQMMIRMFDVDGDGGINFDEFCALWSFLAAWRALFEQFDTDRSGHVSIDEYSKALVAFGYRLSPTFVNMMYTTYDKTGHGRMSFDLFVQSCIVLKRMTDVFKRYDQDRDGFITLSFEQFLTGMSLCTWTCLILEILQQR